MHSQKCLILQLWSLLERIRVGVLAFHLEPLEQNSSFHSGQRACLPERPRHYPSCSTSGFSLSWFQCFKWQWNALVITIKTMKFQRDLRSSSLHLTFLRCGTYDLEDWLSQRDYTASHCTAHLPHTCPGIFPLERTKWHLHPLLNYFKKTMEAKFVYNMPLNRNMML